MAARVLVVLCFFIALFALPDPSFPLTLTYRFTPEVSKRTPEEIRLRKALGSCPPFYLRDEDGNIIDPVHGINADKPYSPRKTCGLCHDYDLITSAYHFQQGRGEEPAGWMKERYPWILSPGTYGGRWCSPGPPDRVLAGKQNRDPLEIDLTSFEYAYTCGICHPGGGPLELDRSGKRYDVEMRRRGYTPGGENSLDGDYYRSFWTETGVVEADCLICHMKGYDFRERIRQLSGWNFKWAAVAGSGLARVVGSVRRGEVPEVKYDLSRFYPDGRVKLRISRRVPSENCLFCHAGPDLKKKGDGYDVDVHIKRGMECVDCHRAGEEALDPRIKGTERHEIGKGDSPAGFVRNDLDNTVLDCGDCHLKGRGMRAPHPEHRGLPPIHFRILSCQACHIPTRFYSAVFRQDSTIFNTMPGVHGFSRIWVFYGPDLNPWNCEGDLARGIKRRAVYAPLRMFYRGKIYPVSIPRCRWFGVREKGKIVPVLMRDLYAFWTEQILKNTPLLRAIKDDDGDGFPEIDTEKEIRMALEELERRLGKEVVLVDGRRVYSKTAVRTLPDDWLPYTSAYKITHGVLPAGSALGAGGCGDCHSPGSGFFRSVVGLKKGEGPVRSLGNLYQRFFRPLSALFVIYPGAGLLSLYTSLLPISAGAALVGAALFFSGKAAGVLLILLSLFLFLLDRSRPPEPSPPALLLFGVLLSAVYPLFSGSGMAAVHIISGAGFAAHALLSMKERLSLFLLLTGCAGLLSWICGSCWGGLFLTAHCLLGAAFLLRTYTRLKQAASTSSSPEA